LVCPLREEYRLRVFENRVLRELFGAKRDEVTGEWRKLHNEELNDLHCSPNRDRTRWTEHVAGMGERRGVYRVLVGKTERKGRLISRWQGNVTMGGGGGGGGIYLTQVRGRSREHGTAVINRPVP
jgi:hypothetical protein